MTPKERGERAATIFNANDRQRLYIEGKEFLKVRAQRKKFVKSQATA